MSNRSLHSDPSGCTKAVPSHPTAPKTCCVCSPVETTLVSLDCQPSVPGMSWATLSRKTASLVPTLCGGPFPCVFALQKEEKKERGGETVCATSDNSAVGELLPFIQTRAGNRHGRCELDGAGCCASRLRVSLHRYILFLFIIMLAAGVTQTLVHHPSQGPRCQLPSTALPAAFPTGLPLHPVTTHPGTLQHRHLLRLQR